MKKNYWKGCLRDLGRSKSRFFAIVAIVALGAGFFGGIKATSIDMKLTADQYYRETNLNDFRLVSTLGITNKDAEAIAALDGVKEVMPSYQLDAVTEGSETDNASLSAGTVVRFHSLPMDGERINRTVLVEGRMPEAANECVIVAKSSVGSAYQVGDVITLSLKEDPDLAEDMNETSFTVVGLVNSPLYMSLDKSSTNKGSGTVSTYAFLPESAFHLEAYTELYVRLAESVTDYCFGDEYEALTGEWEKTLKDIGVERCELRKAEIVDEATAELDDAKREYEEKKTEAEEKLADAKRQLDDAAKEIADGERTLADSRREAADAEQKIAEARQEAADGEKELAEKQKEFDDKITEAQKELDDAKAEIDENQKKVDDAWNLLNDSREALAANQKKFEEGKAELDRQREAAYAEVDRQVDAQVVQAKEKLAETQNGLAQAQAAIAGMTPATPGYTELQTTIIQLQELIPQIQAGLALAEQGRQQGYAQADEALAPYEYELTQAQGQLEEGWRELEKGAREAALGEDELESGKREYERGKKDFEDEKADAERQLADARQKLEDGKQEIADGEQELADGKRKIADGERELADAKVQLADAKAEYEEKKAEAEEKLADAHEKILDAEEEIADIETPDWYVLGRNSSAGYASFEQDAERVDAIAMVFPVFFFLVAALVCLTTMTRMIEEERTQVGVLKALGYGKGIILAKYLFYAAATSLIGSVIGLLIGFQVFPRVIWAAYGIMYTTPAILAPFNWGYAAIATAVFLVCTVGATFLACWSELMSVPANLIRPKPPKTGKRVFLEHIPFLWKHMSFTKKLTARNILRYKKRFFMTVVGVAGCTALMLTGFGLKDSISGIVQNQFGNLFHYDMQAALAHDLDLGAPSERQARLLDTLESDGRVTDFLLLHQENITALSEKSEKRMDAYLIVPEDTEKISDFITFRDRRSREVFPYPEAGAFISEKLSNELGLKKGDALTLEDTDSRQYSLPVAGIIENYVYNYVYLSPGQYEETFEKPCLYRGMFAKISETGAVFEEKLSADLLGNSELMSVSYTSSTIDTFTQVFDRLNLIVLVLIISASLLAFVVLYNLTNINVNERIREIATIKVLGFYDKEVDSYVYRENIVLTVIGILLGFAGGVFLHQYVMRMAEVNLVMFGRDILPLSYLWAGLLTLVFAGAVNFVMHFRLKRISMVESLKSIE